MTAADVRDLSWAPVEWCVARVPPDDQAGARLIARMAMLMASIALAFVLIACFMTPIPDVIGALGIASLASCIPVLLRVTGSIKWASHAFVGGLTGSVVWAAWRGGGDGHGALGALTVAPAIALLLVDRRSGIAWAAAVMTIVLVYGVAYQAGLMPPPLSSPAQLSLIDTIATIIVIAGISGVALLSASANLRAREAARLAHESLRVAHEGTLVASRAKTAFLSNMSHEIRTPLNGMLGMTALLIDTPLTAAQRELAAAAHRSGEYLLEIVNEILDFSKIEAGQLSLEPLPMDLALAVDEVADVMRERAQAKDVELIVRVAPTVPRHVVCDPVRLRQILLNLVGNAIKFTRSGHVFIDVNGEADGTVAHIVATVEDTGIGIPPDKLDVIFEKFAQADNSTTRQFGGTGLGLAIVRELVLLMDGTIEVNSVLGQGSTFITRLDLPIHTALIAPAHSPPDSLAGVHLLILDANPLTRRVLHEQACTWGARSEHVGAVEEALTALTLAMDRDDPFRAAVLGHRIPGLDGEGLARLIRRNPRLSATALVMLTSSAAPSLVAQAIEAGFDRCLVKPAPTPKLHDAIVAALAIVRGTSATEPDTAPAPTLRPAAVWRVLLAEDNLINQTVAQLFLEKLGCQVDVAANGREAVDLAEKLSYDLVFMDCQMPILDGYKATALIRRLPPPNDVVPIVALTAHALGEERARSLACGMDDHATKPITLAALQQLLTKWLQQPRT